MSFAILGAGGQLGQAFLRRLREQATGLKRAQLDLTRPETVREVLTQLRPKVVINCAAYNLVDQAESDPAPAFAVNAWGVQTLAQVCWSLDCVLVHFSTNYAFGLDRQRYIPYTETDPPAPQSVYAVSKVAGEYFAKAHEKHFVIRTTGLFGKKGPGGKTNFVDLMLRLAREGKTIRVVNDQVCSPTFVDDLVDATLRLLETNRFGLYHLTSAGQCTWHEIAQAIFARTGIQADLRGVSTADYGAPAPRPAYSVLANNAYSRLGLPPIRHWQEGLASYH